MIIGTAGHIDHGKTSLVRALTGVDTDRLPEEKKRGITIELGYAYLPLADGQVLGFVDVPGHERFIHTMLAGATGIDFALLIVAADDGVMPQTREHLEILHLLGVTQGAVAITKMDRVDPARLADVKNEVSNLLATTTLTDAPLFPVSSVTREGIDVLLTHLADAKFRVGKRHDAGRFRLAVDRVFTLDGVGTVVTGSVASGSVASGDTVALAPRASSANIRIRGLRAQNQPVDRGAAGQRCALNLAGIARDAIARGDWVVDPASTLTTTRLDASLMLLSSEPQPLRAGTAVHVHAGAAHVTARVVPLDRDRIEPGGSGVVQIVTDQPIAAWHADRFILRDASAQRTLAGGAIIDPLAPARYRRTPERLATLAAMARDNPAASLQALAKAAPLGVDLATFLRTRDRDTARLDPDTLGLKRVQGHGSDRLFTPAHWAALTQKALALTGEFHAKHAEDIGLDIARLKRIAFPKLPEAALHALVAELVRDGKLVRTGVWLQLPAHAAQLSDQDRVLAEMALPLLAEGAFDPPWVRDIAKTIGHPESIVRALLSRMARRGEIYQVVKDLFYDASSMHRLAALADRIQNQHGVVRAAEFRDATGLGRKRAIQVLEFFDRIGFTRRVADDHIIRTRELFDVGVRDHV
ncbi:MAG: selenocysteine-specific translation elongation factor [Betaproteobacteria bacterium]|nr:selenocysteine-specific translation elongation factor [Betaproteobacteria bacterium]